jgi:hypothetical protein
VRSPIPGILLRTLPRARSASVGGSRSPAIRPSIMSGPDRAVSAEATERVRKAVDLGDLAGQSSLDEHQPARGGNQQPAQPGLAHVATRESAADSAEIFDHVGEDPGRVVAQHHHQIVGLDPNRDVEGLFRIVSSGGSAISVFTDSPSSGANVARRSILRVAEAYLRSVSRARGEAQGRNRGEMAAL